MALKLVRSFQCIHDLIWKQRGFEVRIKNVKWHFFYGLLSLYVSVQTLKSNNQVLRSWRRSLQTLQTLQKSASKWSQRLSPARICFKHWKDFCDESLSILILKAQLLVSFSQIQQCVMFWVLFNSPKLWHLFVLEVTKERWNLNYLIWKRSSSEARSEAPLWPGENRSWSDPGVTKLPCLM